MAMSRANPYYHPRAPVAAPVSPKDIRGEVAMRLFTQEIEMKQRQSGKRRLNLETLDFSENTSLEQLRNLKCLYLPQRTMDVMDKYEEEINKVGGPSDDDELDWGFRMFTTHNSLDFYDYYKRWLAKARRHFNKGKQPMNEILRLIKSNEDNNNNNNNVDNERKGRLIYSMTTEFGHCFDNLLCVTVLCMSDTVWMQDTESPDIILRFLKRLFDLWNEFFDCMNATRMLTHKEEIILLETLDNYKDEIMGLEYNIEGRNNKQSSWIQDDIERAKRQLAELEGNEANNDNNHGNNNDNDNNDNGHNGGGNGNNWNSNDNGSDDNDNNDNNDENDRKGEISIVHMNNNHPNARWEAQERELARQRQLQREQQRQREMAVAREAARQRQREIELQRQRRLEMERRQRMERERIEKERYERRKQESLNEMENKILTLHQQVIDLQSEQESIQARIDRKKSKIEQLFQDMDDLENEEPPYKRQRRCN